MKIVTIGGGTGTYAVLSELRRRKENGEKIEISAIVAMSDSGGSTGILMDSYGVLPAGDIRQALVALSKNQEILRELFAYRYPDGVFQGHSFGNIFLSTLEKVSDSFPKAIEEAEKILNTQGKVYPVSLEKHELIAEMKNGEKIISEKNLDNADLRNLEKIYFSKNISLNPEIEKVLEEADLVVVNPGSFYTSIMPNFLVSGLAEKLKKISAQKIFITNIVTEKNQTDNFKVLDFLTTLGKHSNFADFDFVLYNQNRKLVGDDVLKRYEEEGKFFVEVDEKLEWKNTKFVGGDFLKQPDLADKKHLLRTDTQKIFDKIFELVKKERIYIFDLDHTLLNAKVLLNDLSLLLSGEFDMISEDIWNHFKLKDEKLIKFLENHLEKYLFDGVVENLKKIKDRKILLTFGDIEFQKKKVEALGLDKVFDEVILTDEHKIDFLKDFVEKNKGEEIIFVNDNYNKRFLENAEIKKVIPEIKIFEVDNYSENKNKKIQNIFELI